MGLTQNMKARVRLPQSMRHGWQERMQALRNVPPVMQMFWDSAPRSVALSLAFRLIVALLPLGALLITRLIINGVVAYVAHTGPLPKHFWFLVVADFVIAGLSVVLTRAIDYLDEVLAERFTMHSSLRIMKHATELDLASYEDPNFYDQLERARVQAIDRVSMIRALGQLIQQSIVAISLAASVFLFSPWLVLILVACVVPAFLGETHYAFQGYAQRFRQTPIRRRLDYLRTLASSKETAKEAKLFGLGSFFTERYDAFSNQIIAEDISLARRKLVAGSLLGLASTACYYGCYAFVIYRTVTGHLTVGDLTFLAGAIAGTSTNIQAIFSTFSGLADQALFLGDLVRFFSIGPQICNKPNAVKAPRPILQGFEFRNVSFTYPGRTQPVFRDLNFRIEPGERVALIGENGQGKTTIVKLLVRLYEPTGGVILLDGIPLQEYDLEDLWKEIGVIFQDFVHYEMSAAENIAAGRIEDLGNLPNLVMAAKKSRAHELISSLPEGYAQILGRRFERGLDLSGGEWQKIALARAYLRDAQLLILDEPTASLDARAEHEVFSRFAELTTSKMALLISHRFSTVRMADKILVLANGTIVEEGSHAELMSQRGQYSEMFELQASNYR
ncbi:MAG TPA: ABC transporter ATP-binding protein [Terriglobales bacterium]|nr:ABC transporter ATP-binding protein [Terriglobales bacterium]